MACNAAMKLKLLCHPARSLLSPLLSFSTGPMKKKRKGYLYLARMHYPAQEFHLGSSLKSVLDASKIGIVHGRLRSVRSRLSSLNTGNPFKLHFEKVVPSDNPLLMEKYWHVFFRKCNIRGEWFHLSHEQIQDFYQVTTTYHQTGIFHGDTALLEEIRLSGNKIGNRISMSKSAIIPLTFENVKGILDQHRNHLRDLPAADRSYLESEELDVVLKALENHPDAKTKIGVGVTDIFVQEVRMEGLPPSHCFHVKRIDGSEEDFSYHYTDTRLVERSPLLPFYKGLELQISHVKRIDGSEEDLLSLH
jgi:hypothetical protein